MHTWTENPTTPTASLDPTALNECLMHLKHDVPGFNYLANSSFEVAQDGLGPFTGSGYTFDQTRVQNVGTTFSTTRGSFALGQALVDGNPEFFMQTVITSVAGAGNYFFHDFVVEGVETLNGQRCSFGIEAAADAAKAISVEFIQNFGTGGSPSAMTATVAGKNTLSTVWGRQKFENILIPSIAGKTIGSNGNDCLMIRVWFDAGANYNSETLSLGQKSGTLYLACPKLEYGPVCTYWQKEDPAITWARCLRFYEVINATAIFPYIANPNCGAGQTVALSAPFRVIKRATPTVAVYGTWSVANCGQPSAGALADSFLIWVVSVGAGGVVAQPTATSGVRFSARL